MGFPFGETIATTALSTPLEWLINYLGSKTSEWWNSWSQVPEDLQKWNRLLPKLYAVLDDAEKRQTTDRAVELWLSELSDVVYEMEDVLDGLEADERRKKLTAKTDQPSTSKKRKWISTFIPFIPGFGQDDLTDQPSTSKKRKWFSTFIPGSSQDDLTDQPSTSKKRKWISTFVPGFGQDDFILDRETVNKIKEISVRLEGIMKEKEALDLKVGEAKSSVAASPRKQTTWLAEPHVYGREADKDAILQKVLNDGGGDENPCVIPIVGMGGLGKTTLARLVYNDARLNGVFHPKAWVCVSDEFDVDQIIRSILEQITQKKCDSDDPNVVQGKVNDELSGKKFLLVLDDVWSEDYNCWDELQRVIRSGAVRSKIVVTSRIQGVAKTMGATDRIYHLKELQKNQCLSLLARQALRRENFDAHSDLLDIAEKIVERCRGLPLALKTLGGVLRDELNPKKWAEVLNSGMWELPEGRRHILPALRLSYHHLPPHLKRCFAYCALFPKNHEFLQNDLVLLWMAEGFVPQKNEAKQMKRLGDQYFCDLLSRGLFQQSSSDQSHFVMHDLVHDQSRFVMHDLVHDLAQHVAGETCCNFENVIHGGKMLENFERVRHLSLSDLSGFRQSGFLDKLNNLRTLLVLRQSFHPQDDEFFQECLQKLRSLRVLTLDGLSISEVPNSIGELKHLRYIDLSFSAIKSLPHSVRSLVYLQTMKLWGCSKIEELPEGIGDLVDLHHLDISHTEIKKMPPQMGNLKNLLMLPKFIVGESGGLRLKELSNLKDLQGELLIQDLHNVSDDQDASEASLFKMEGLEILTLKWNNDFQTLQDESVELQLKVLSQLKPHSNLKRLKIDSYGGLEFPSWMGEPSVSKLEYLELCNCGRSTSLPWLGRLPQLKELVIRDMLEAITMDPEFHSHSNSSCDSFPLLEKLILLDCPKLIRKLPGHIPSLVRLEIKRCPQLTYSPMCLPSLQELDLEDCNEAVLRSVFDSTSLTTLSITRISELTCLPRSITQYMTALETVKIKECGELHFLLEDGDSLKSMIHIPSLVRLKIKRCPQLTCSPMCLPSLQELDLNDCNEAVLRSEFDSTPLTTLSITRILELTCLPRSITQYMTALETLEIKECGELIFLLEDGDSLSSLSSLKRMIIQYCDNLERLANGLHSLTCLEELYIRRCKKFVGFLVTDFPLYLQFLALIDLEALELLPDQLVMRTEKLLIKDCPRLKSFSTGELLEECGEVIFLLEDGDSLSSLSSLKSMIIECCDNLERLANGLHGLTCLEELYIRRCKKFVGFLVTDFPLYLQFLALIDLEALESLPDQLVMRTEKLLIKDCPRLKSFSTGELLEESLPELSSPTLKTLNIQGCDNLKSLPNGMYKCTSLQEFTIGNCPGITSIPRGGLPSNLTRLLIDCESLEQSMLEWGLDRLTSLEEFEIHWICPPDDSLPISLKTLKIKRVCNLKSISKGLLQSLASLQHLAILYCPLLETLPNEGLPRSLLSIQFTWCPLLEQRCLENGDYWPLISHIPRKCIGVRYEDSIAQFITPSIRISLEVLEIYGCPRLQRRCLEERGNYWPLISHMPERDIGARTFSHNMEVVTSALSVSLEWLIKYLGSKSTAWWNSRMQICDDLQNWKSFLPKLCAVLDDAEMRQVTNPAVEMWLSDLKHLAYDMEDVLDGLEADKRRKKLTAKTDQPSTSKKRKLIPTRITGHNQDDFILDQEAVSKIKEISGKLECVAKEKEALDLKDGKTRSSMAASPREWTTWLPEPYVYGREADKDAILQKVLNDEDGDENPCVISIVGMGGLGKTTLARLVYNDARLNGVFDLKAWVCVSDEFDVLQITRSILEQIAQSKCDSKDPSVLQGKVNNMLSGKKFLLVLDDVWSEDSNCWDVLQRVFRSGAVGSKIVVTSRIKVVAKTMGATDRIYHLKELPENHCLSLLAGQALRRKNFDAHLYLFDIAKKIVERCRGLPLAVKTLGGVLLDELNPKKWAEVLNSEMWELPEGRRHILPALRLSYHYLPAHLKKCFAYCALFPKDHEFLQYDLVLLWMAEGFVQQQKNETKQMKRLGDQYFCDLLSRGLFQQSSSDQSRFVMHDLVHDLAQHVAGETCCNFENVIHSGKIPENFERVRHLSLSDLSGFRQTGFLDKLNNLRTLLVLRPRFHLQDGEFFQECLQKLRALRVLSLRGVRILEVPNSIGELKHLRYIDLSDSQLESLPNSVRSLVYLQTMKLCGCSKIGELPEGIVDLVELHHLDISHTEIKKMPPQMGNLKNLLMLPKFIVGESGGLRLKDLSNLKDLQGELLIQDLHNVFDDQDASEASLFKMEDLEILTLKWNNDFQTLQDESVELQLKVLSQLKPHSNLKRLKIDSYGGLEFPSWMGEPSVSKLEYLELCNCGRSTSLPWLGRLPQLKELVIRDMPEAITMNAEFHSHSSCDSFPLLEKLILLDCPKLIRKLPGHIPSLVRLEIKRCPQLTYSPMSLPSLQELYLDDCKGALLRSVFDSTSLTKLCISRISELTCLPGSFTQYMTTLETLEIRQCGELLFLLEDGDSLSSFVSLKRMEIESCDNLECLPNGLHSLACLEELIISECKKFMGFLVTDFPLYLQFLQLFNLEALESLPDELMMTTERLDIFYCPRLKSFSTGELLARLEESLLERLFSSPTLKTLQIYGCDNLKSLPNGIYNCTSLQELKMRDCPRIASIPRGGLPPNLKRLLIDCESLKQPMLEWGLDRLTSLETFEIHWICPLDDLLPISLKTLIIRSVGDLKSISKGLLRNLSSLRVLEIEDCPELKTLPREGLPPSLEKFKINGCPLLERRCLEEKGDYWPLISHIP